MTRQTMDNSSNCNSGPSPSNSSNNTQTQQRHQNTQNGNRNYRSRQQVEREPYKDLRELLNHKRQNADSKNGGPPSDPKYNYLSDPMRDGESSNGNSTNSNNIGTGRFANQRFNFRNPASRGRGRGNYIPEKSYHQKPGYISNEPTRFPREWDQGKEDPRNRRYNTYKNPQHSEGPSNYKPNDTTFNFRPQRFHDTRPINTNYKGPPHKYNPNYRGGNRQRFPPRRYQHPDPVNISVEYNVEDGFRRCTALDVKLDKPWKKGQNKRQQPPPEDDVEEENWDEDVADVTVIGGAIGETPENEETEVEEKTQKVKEESKNNDDAAAAAADDTKIGQAIRGTSKKEQREQVVEKETPKVEEQPRKSEATTAEVSGAKKKTPKHLPNERKDIVEGENEGPPKTPNVKEVAAVSTNTKNKQVVEKVEEDAIDKDAADTKTGGKNEVPPVTSKVEVESKKEEIDGAIEETPKNTKPDLVGDATETPSQVDGN